MRGCPGPSVLGVGMTNPGAVHGGDCELRLFAAVITVKVVENQPLARRQIIATWRNAYFCGASSREARGAGAIVVLHRGRCCLDQSLTRGPSDGGRWRARAAAEGVSGNDLVKVWKEKVEVGWFIQRRECEHGAGEGDVRSMGGFWTSTWSMPRTRRGRSAAI